MARRSRKTLRKTSDTEFESLLRRAFRALDFGSHRVPNENSTGRRNKKVKAQES